MKDYKRILQGVVNIINITKKSDIGFANICTYIGENCPELAESEDERIRKELISFVKGYIPDETSKQRKKYLAWLEKQGEKESDPRYKYLKELLRADDIYQMAMNDAMVQEAKTKAIDALSKLEIGNLLELEKQGEQKPHEDIVDEINRKAFPNHYGGCAPVLEIKQTKICKMVGPDDPEHLADIWDLLPNIFIGMEMCIEGTMYRIKDIRTIICGDLYRQIIEVE